MKTLIVYTSQTGFTQRYAEWLAEEMKADILNLKEAQKKDEYRIPRWLPCVCMDEHDW